MGNDILGAILGAITGLSGGGDTLSAPVQVVPADYRPLQLSAVGRLYDVHPRDVREATVNVRETPSLILEFEPDLADWVAATTSIAIGDVITMSLCGEEVMTAVIQEPIVDGRVQITGGSYGVEELIEMSQLISGEQLCDTPAPSNIGK